MGIAGHPGTMRPQCAATFDWYDTDPGQNRILPMRDPHCRVNLMADEFEYPSRNRSGVAQPELVLARQNRSCSLSDAS